MCTDDVFSTNLSMWMTIGSHVICSLSASQKINLAETSMCLMPIGPDSSVLVTEESLLVEYATCETDSDYSDLSNTLGNDFAAILGLLAAMAGKTICHAVIIRMKGSQKFSK